jgi:hypothetical protein
MANQITSTGANLVAAPAPAQAPTPAAAGTGNASQGPAVNQTQGPPPSPPGLPSTGDDLPLPNPNLSADMPDKEVHEDLSTLMMIAMQLAMKAQKEARKMSLEMAFKAQANFKQAAKDAYDKEIDAAESNFKAAKAAAIGKIAGGAVQGAFTVGAGLNLRSSKKQINQGSDKAHAQSEQIKADMDKAGKQFESEVGGLRTRLDKAKQIEKLEGEFKQARTENKAKREELESLYRQREQATKHRDDANNGDDEFLAHRKVQELDRKVVEKEEALGEDNFAVGQKAAALGRARQEQDALLPDDIRLAKSQAEGKLGKLQAERSKLEGHWDDVVDKTEPEVANHYRREFKKVDKAIETEKKVLASHEKEEKTVEGLGNQINQKYEAHAKYQETAQRNLETVQRMAQKDAAMSDWKIKASMTWNQMAGATASVVSPAGEAIGATYTLDGATESADAKKLTAGQESENMDYQRQMSTADSWIEAFKKGLDVMSTTTQAAVEMSKTAARNIA